MGTSTTWDRKYSRSTRITIVFHNPSVRLTQSENEKGVRMDSTAFWGKPGGDRIGGDRREDRRYQLQLECKWKLIRRRKVLDTGTGHTIDVSSGGLLFDAGRHLPEGLNVELSIAWPVLLHNVAPMQLVASGKIVRSSGRRVAIQTVAHEFRTSGISAVQHPASTSGTHDPAVLSNPATFAVLGRL